MPHIGTFSTLGLWLALSSIPRQSTESLASLEDTLEGAALVWEAGILPMMDLWKMRSLNSEATGQLVNEQ